MSEPAPPVPHRRLGASLPAPSAKEVHIVFGVDTSETEWPTFAGSPDWSFDSEFQPSSPWAQRAMKSMCSDVPSNLNVLEKQCWILNFRKWRLDQGLKFPTGRFDNFQEELQKFLGWHPHSATAMWFDENNTMRASAFGLKVPARPDVDAHEIMKDRDLWLDYVQRMNSVAQSQARNAFATSQAWADAEAMDLSTRNAWHVVLLAIGVAVFAGLIYTWDAVFILVTIVLSVLACTWLSFFIFCLFGWAVGPWELILLVVFLSYAIEPVFRIGRGAVWSDYHIGRKVLHVVSPRLEESIAEDHQAAVAGAGNPPPPAIVDAGAPPGAPPDAGHPGGGVPDREADLLSTGSRTEAAAMADANNRFEARLAKHTLFVANACFGNAVKMIICGILMMPCEFRLFARMGVVSIMVPIISLPCIFLLLPSALLLIPRNSDLPDAVRLYHFTNYKVFGAGAPPR